MSISTVNSPVFATAASIAAIAVLLLSTTPVCAAEITSLTIQNLNLDLDSQQGAEDLYERLETAARSACRPLVDTANNVESVNRQQCEQSAIQNAVSLFNLPLLTMAYDRHCPRQALPAVSVSYAPRDNVSGYITARLRDGERYSGEYLEPRQYAHFDSADPFWNQWSKDFDRKSALVFPEYVGQTPTTYARNQVLAGMKDAEGAPMRCRFALSSPSSGLSGGAEGECILPAGQTVNVAIPRA